MPPMDVRQFIESLSVDGEIVDPFARSRWAEVEHDLGLTLPSDYKELVSTLGVGSFDELVDLAHPDRPRGRFSLRARITSVADYLELLRRFDLQDGIDRFPPDARFVPWGLSFDGQYALWLVDGEPDDWTVVTGDKEGLERWDLSLVDFLDQYLDERISPRTFSPSGARDRRFVPFHLPR
jgi:hypothetical protein